MMFGGIPPNSTAKESKKVSYWSSNGEKYQTAE